MEAIVNNVPRRALFLAGGVGALALAGFAAGAEAAPSEAETANVKFIKDFCNSWNDPDKAATWLAPDSSVRFTQDTPALIGPAAYTKSSKEYLAGGIKFAVKFLQIFAHGSIVVTVRDDTMTTPGKPDQIFKCVGVFYIKNGKIKEWTDYIQA